MVIVVAMLPLPYWASNNLFASCELLASTVTSIFPAVRLPPGQIFVLYFGIVFHLPVKFPAASAPRPLPNQRQPQPIAPRTGCPQLSSLSL